MLHKLSALWINVPQYSLFTDAKGKTNDLLHVQSTEKRVFHHSEKLCGLFLQEKGFCFSKHAPYLSSLHHFLPLTSKVNGADTKLKLGFSELLTFGVCLLLTVVRHYKMQDVRLVHWDYLNVCVFCILAMISWLISQLTGNWEKDIFPFKSLSTHKQRKEQQWVKQWVLVFQHSTCPIIYTPLTGSILNSVIGGKLFVSKCLAHSESTSAGVWVINDLWPYCVEVAN